MMLKRGGLVACMILTVSLLTTLPAFAGDPARVFRQANGLQSHLPPQWFLQGNFIAREKNPQFIFGTVENFVKMLGGTTTWLIEDMERERIKAAATTGKKIEYTLYLESVSAGSVMYWVFVVLPYENAQAWYDGKRTYHGRKAKKYYGRTPEELERARRQGYPVNAELRFWIARGETSLHPPEEVIMTEYKFQPLFNLGTGQPLAASKNK